MNTFVKNPLIPDGMMALVKIIDGTYRETIWYGPARDVPEDEFAEADESHVSEATYNRIAERAEATGKGMKLQ